MALGYLVRRRNFSAEMAVASQLCGNVMVMMIVLMEVMKVPVLKKHVVILTLLAMMVIVCLEGGNVMEMLTVKMLQTKAQKCVT